MSLAERLGYTANDRVLILNADDFGSTHASNAATFECLEQGSLTSGSMLVPAGWFPEVAAVTANAPSRAKEYELFKDQSIAEELARPGIHTITYREIREAYREGRSGD